MKLHIRDASHADSDLLFEWVNTPDSLANKRLTKGAIDRSDHEQWFRRRLADNETHMFILQNSDRPIGQIRFQAQDDAHEVDVFLEGSCRGRGVAREALIICAQAFFRRNIKNERLRARVLVHNERSARLFEASGFTLVSSDDEQMIFECRRSCSSA